MIKTYRNLIVWQKSFDLSLLVYRFTKNFPKEEIYALTSQIRRAAVSIPSNIAGAELETQLMISKELGYSSNREFNDISSLLSEVMKMLNSLIKKIKTSA